MPPKTCKDCPADSKRPAPYPGPRCATHNREVKKQRSEKAHGKRIEATYGITTNQYRAIWEAQGGRCAICQRANGTRKRLAVDHDHKTGEVRGLLCGPCNHDVLGHLREDIDALNRAIGYLINPPARTVLGENP